MTTPYWIGVYDEHGQHVRTVKAERNGDGDLWTFAEPVALGAGWSLFVAIPVPTDAPRFAPAKDES